MKALSKSISKRTARHGAALVEFAICLPVLVLIVLGSIEAASAVFVRQGLVIAAYEASRAAVRRDGTIENATARAVAILQQRNINSATVEIKPDNLGDLKRGDSVTVRIVAGMQSNSPFFGRVIQDRNVTVSTTMVRE